MSLYIRIILFLKDSLKVTKRVLNKKISNIFGKTIFEKQKPKTINTLTESATNELDDLVVLSLFASFERQLRKEIITKSLILEKIDPTKLGKKISSQVSKEIEYWKIDEIIDLFNPVVDSYICGQLKEIKRYRDWLAHGKMRKKSVSADPKTTFETIKLFCDELNNNTKI